jgi:hypothetical protein
MQLSKKQKTADEGGFDCSHLPSLPLPAAGTQRYGCSTTGLREYEIPAFRLCFTAFRALNDRFAGQRSA